MANVQIQEPDSTPVPPPVPPAGEEEEIRNLCASVGCGAFADNFIERRLSPWQVGRALVQILNIVVGPKPRSWGAFQSDAALERDIFEERLRAALLSALHHQPSAPREVSSEFVSIATPAPRDIHGEELGRWFRNLDDDHTLRLMASPEFEAVQDHDAFAAHVAREMLHGLRRRNALRRRMLGSSLHVAGDRTATYRQLSRRARPFYRGETRYATPGRFLDLALAEYVLATRMLRKRLRLVVATAREERDWGYVRRARAVRAHLRTLNPASTWKHVVMVLERFGNDLGPGTVAAKTKRLEVYVSRERAPSTVRASEPRLTPRQPRRAARKKRPTRRGR